MAAKKKKKAAQRPAKKPAQRAAKPAARKAAKPAARAAAHDEPTLTPRRQPETLRFRSIGVGFTVNDIGKSADFYTRILGFVAGDKWEQDGRLLGLEIKAGAANFWINQDDFQKGRDRVKGVGVRVYCNTAQDIDTLAKGIKKRGGVLDHEPMTQSWGVRDFGITDPDGYRITIQNIG